MNNIKDFLIGLTVNFLAQVAVFFQLQGSIKIELLKNNYWLVVLSGIPISMLFMAATKYIATSNLWILKNLINKAEASITVANARYDSAPFLR